LRSSAFLGPDVRGHLSDHHKDAVGRGPLVVVGNLAAGAHPPVKNRRAWQSRRKRSLI
jgi:hypothetical protein